MLTGTQIHNPEVRRLARQLPNLHSAIYGGLCLLLPDQLRQTDCLVSRCESGPDLYLNVIERHDYTTYLQLTYLLGEQQLQNPNAFVRVYHDAKLAEATAFSPEQGIRRFAGPELPIHGQVVRSWRLNRALVKWLDHLLGQGHSLETFDILEMPPQILAL